jgi:hypothetical protein
MDQDDLSSKMDLFVEVRGHEIIVSESGTGHCVTYRRHPDSPILEALCSMRCDPDAETLRFFTEAWKAAYAKAKALGWL